MKKLLLAIFSISLLFQSVFAYYTPTFKDVLIVKQLSNAIENLIDDKGEEYRDIYLERLEKIKIWYSHKERIVYIIDWTIEKLSKSGLVDDLLDGLTKVNQFSTNFYCQNKLKIPTSRTIFSETTNEIIIKTVATDTLWYDVYIRWNDFGINANNDPSVMLEFQGWNIVAQIDCAPWECYWVKINQNTMCSFNREIYTNQPRPVSMPSDWFWAPTINSYTNINNNIYSMLLNSY